MTNSAQLARDRLSVAVAVDRAVQAVTPKAQIEYHDVPSSDAIKMGQIFGASMTDSGAIVNERTAMRVSAVYRCVSLIAGAIATTPCSFYRRTEGGREKANDHPYWWLFNEQPTPLFTSASFWEFATGQMLLRGDGIAYIVRASRFSPQATAVIPVHRDKVEITRKGQRLRYKITDQLEDGSEGYFTVDQDDVLHFPGLGFDGTCSRSVIGWAARQAIGIAIKADEHAAQTFAGGASIQYAVKIPGKMTSTQQEEFRQAWVAKYGAGTGHSKIPLVLTEGLSVEELSMTAADAQLLESRKFQVVDIARAFGVPPHMIGETSASTSWGTGIEQMSQGFVRYTLRPHLHRFAQEMNRKLFPRLDRYFVEFNVDGLLEGDSKAQAEYFGKALGGPGAMGWMTVNEVRALKNLPPIAGGDKLFMPTAKAADTKKETRDEPDESADPAAGAES
ncbi:phage portal protein [Lysobacter fragariae]